MFDMDRLPSYPFKEVTVAFTILNMICKHETMRHVGISNSSYPAGCKENHLF